MKCPFGQVKTNGGGPWWWDKSRSLFMSTSKETDPFGHFSRISDFALMNQGAWAKSYGFFVTTFLHETLSLLALVKQLSPLYSFRSPHLSPIKSRKVLKAWNNKKLSKNFSKNFCIDILHAKQYSRYLDHLKGGYENEKFKMGSFFFRRVFTDLLYWW